MISVIINYVDYKEPTKKSTKSFLLQTSNMEEKKEEINNFVSNEILGQYQEGIHFSNTFDVIIVKYPITETNNTSTFTFNLDKMDDFDISDCLLLCDNTFRLIDKKNKIIPGTVIIKHCKYDPTDLTLEKKVFDVIDVEEINAYVKKVRSKYIEGYHFQNSTFVETAKGNHVFIFDSPNEFDISKYL